MSSSKIYYFIKSCVFFSSSSDYFYFFEGTKSTLFRFNARVELGLLIGLLIGIRLGLRLGLGLLIGLGIIGLRIIGSRLKFETFKILSILIKNFITYYKSIVEMLNFYTFSLKIFKSLIEL